MKETSCELSIQMLPKLKFCPMAMRNADKIFNPDYL